jgi:hypothetical protein
MISIFRAHLFWNYSIPQLLNSQQPLACTFSPLILSPVPAWLLWFSIDTPLLWFHSLMRKESVSKPRPWSV